MRNKSDDLTVSFKENFQRYLPIRTFQRRSTSGGGLSFKNSFARFLNDAGRSPALFSDAFTDSLSPVIADMPVGSLIQEINRQMVSLANNFLFN